MVQSDASWSVQHLTLWSRGRLENTVIRAAETPVHVKLTYNVFNIFIIIFHIVSLFYSILFCGSVILTFSHTTTQTFHFNMSM